MRSTTSGVTTGVSLKALAAAMPFTVDSPDFHGAKHDGSTDDTAAINAAISNAVTTAISAGSYYAEVWFSAAVYAVKGSLTQGGATLGNAQIPLPVIASTGQKFVLVLKSAAGTGWTGFSHWQQNVIQKGGATLVTTLNSGFDGTYGTASCIGGPTTQQLGGTDGGFSNMMIGLDGLTIVTPANAAGAAVDIRCVAQMNVGDLNLTASVIPPNGVTDPSNGSFGLCVPMAQNNDQSNIRTLSVEGFQYGLIGGEHLQCQKYTSVYCDTAIYITQPSNHGMTFQHVSVEQGQHVVDVATTSSQQPMPLMIQLCDTEAQGSTDFVDGSNGQLSGLVYFNNSAHTNPSVSTAPNLKIINLSQATGHVTSPGFPGNGVALTNPFFRDAFVTVSSLTGLTVDGQTVALTSGAASVMVPSGKAITPSYTSGQAWTWWLQ